MAIRRLLPKSDPSTTPNYGPVRKRIRPVAPPPSSDTEEATTNKPDQAAAANPYTVGYGKPPLETRFQKGRSGNPKGRPKEAKGLKTIVRETMSQKVAVRTAGGEKKISRIEAVLHKTIELAMKGNPRALSQLMALYANAVPEVEAPTPATAPTDELTATDLAILEELNASWRGEEADRASSSEKDGQ